MSDPLGLTEGVKGLSSGLDSAREAGKSVSKQIENIQKDATDVAKERAQERVRAAREAELKKERALIKALDEWKRKKQISDEEADLKIKFVKQYGAKEWDALLKIKLDIENMERKNNEEYQHDLKAVRRVQFYCFVAALVVTLWLKFILKAFQMETLLSLLKGVAPVLATAIAGPAGGAAVGWLASKLGIPDDTIEGVTAALTGNPELTLKLKELDLEYAKLEAADRDSARTAYATVATSEHATKLDKSVVPILALGTVSLAFMFIAILMFRDVPVDQQQMVIFALGFITSSAGQVLSFYFGSSQGSKDKTKEIEGLMKK